MRSHGRLTLGDYKISEAGFNLFLPEVATQLPPCRLRPNCRWWQQEGKAACIRCPQIVSETYHPSEQLRQAASPAIADKD